MRQGGADGHGIAPHLSRQSVRLTGNRRNTGRRLSVLNLILKNSPSSSDVVFILNFTFIVVLIMRLYTRGRSLGRSLGRGLGRSLGRSLGRGNRCRHHRTAQDRGALVAAVRPADRQSMPTPSIIKKIRGACVVGFYKLSPVCIV